MTFDEVCRLPYDDLEVVDGNTGEVLSNNGVIVLGAYDDSPITIELDGNKNVIEALPEQIEFDGDSRVYVNFDHRF